ncbi:MAG: DUF7249 family protein [Candidatus Thorarchaeota archaeon]
MSKKQISMDISEAELLAESQNQDDDYQIILDQQTTPDESGYNGWSNYETWAVNLWLTNDQATYQMVSSLPSAEAIKDFVSQWRHQVCLPSGLFADLLTTSLQRVNWYEIYDGLHEEDD